MNANSQVEAQNELMAAVDELFANQSSTITLISGKQVELVPAKLKQLRSITAFIQDFVGGLDDSALVQLISTVSATQQKRIAEGTDPFKLDTREIISQVAGNTSIVMQIVTQGLEAFPQYLPVFTNLTPEEVEDLTLDDLGAVVFGVFGRNYHFFTQQVLPVIRACIAHLSRKAKKTSADD